MKNPRSTWPLLVIVAIQLGIAAAFAALQPRGAGIRLAFWPVALLGYGFYLLQIVIHACSHRALTGFARVDDAVGCVLSVAGFHTFAGWRALHRLHHRFTNEPGKDPTCPLPGEGWFRYVLSILVRMARFTSTPFYRAQSGRSGPLSAQWEVLAGAGLLAVAVIASVVAFGAAGLVYPLGLWVAPWMVGQLLIADFNFRTHDGLPVRTPGRRYDGEDTRSLHGGIWTWINAATLGFYRHREHHLNPRRCLWLLGWPLGQLALRRRGKRSARTGTGGRGHA